MRIKLAGKLSPALAVLTACATDAAATSPKRLLVVSTTVEYRHRSIAIGESVLSRLAAENGAFTVDFVRQPPGMPHKPRPPRLAVGCRLQRVLDAELEGHARRR